MCGRRWMPVRRPAGGGVDTRGAGVGGGWGWVGWGMGWPALRGWGGLLCCARGDGGAGLNEGGLVA